MAVIKVEKPNPDGLDEVFHAYHTLRVVLTSADLCPEPRDRHERAACESHVEEAVDMLGQWLSERGVEGLEVSE